MASDFSDLLKYYKKTEQLQNILKLTASKSDHISQSYYVFKIFSERGNEMDAPQNYCWFSKSVIRDERGQYERNVFVINDD